ncbi:putative tRNA pseudouridine synthase D [Candidatus Gugararchaeum adminiculabundum]|nr:putative tRNA pseudouridine synthase D [Candidatus Gugararchaeum adminiculabundum]
MEKMAFLSKIPGIGGTLKQSAEDFRVEEIMADGTVLEAGKREYAGYTNISANGGGSGGTSNWGGGDPLRGSDFTWFVLEKKNWNTMQVIREISRRCGSGVKRFSYAGTKDRNAHTTQLCSAWKIPCEKLMQVKIKDVQINACWSAKDKVSMGGLAGNRFYIRVNGADEGAGEIVEKIRSELASEASQFPVVPNYFGEQRFGSARMNTHLVGRHICKGEFKEAVENYLFYTDEGERNQQAVEARKRLGEERDYKKALEYFPRILDYEIMMLRHLANNPTDYVNALRKIPRGLSLMFVHSYQSYLFNKILEKRVRERNFDEAMEGEYYCEIGAGGFPDSEIRVEAGTESGFSFVVTQIPGYETEKLNETEKEVFEEEGITQKNFHIKSFPEISAKGSVRTLMTPLVSFEFNGNGGKNEFRFDLQSGAYATVALREFLEKEKEN